MRDLNDLLHPPSKTLHITAGTGITPDGIVVAGALSTNGTVSLVLTPTIFVGDIVPDCQVNIDDLLAVIRDWGATASPSDINNDGIVDMLDLLIVIENWTF